jgi:hypothetical protein
MEKARLKTVTDRDQIAYVQRWRAVIDTQMHFNDMLMRTRAAGVSIVIAVFGAAAVSLAQYPAQLLLAGTTIHIAVVIVLFGLLLLASLFVLDYFYFYRMLIAVVQRAEELEIESRRPGEPLELNLSSCLSRSISRTRASLVLFFFYFIPLLSGLLFLLLIAHLDFPGR